MAKRTIEKKLTVSRETVQRLGVRTSVKTGRLDTSYTSHGGTCDNNCQATGFVCPTNFARGL